MKLLKEIGKSTKGNEYNKIPDLQSIYEKVNLNSEFLCEINYCKSLAIKIICLIRSSDRKEKPKTCCLNELFEITEEEIRKVKKEYEKSKINKENLLYDEEDSELSEYEREKLMNGEYIRGNMNIKYHNNPLYKPITIYENKFLVEILIIISEYITKIVCDIINKENEEIIINLRIFGDYRNICFILLVIFLFKLIF